LAAYWELIKKIWRFEKKNSSKSGEFGPFKYFCMKDPLSKSYFSGRNLAKFRQTTHTHTHTHTLCGLAASSSSSSAFFLQLLLTKIIRKFHEFLMI
jgi:hypothetical protein